MGFLLYSFLFSENVRSVNERIGNWLMDAGLYQASNPYTSNPFRRDQNNLVTEVDGTPSTNFFTFLSIGKTRLLSMYLIMFFSVAARPIELKFHMEHVLDETM